MNTATYKMPKSDSTGSKLFNIFRNGKNGSSDLRKQFDAIHNALAVIEFDSEGIILTANDNFLQAIGYNLNEIVGQHHRMFVDPQMAQSQEYRDFWAELGMGKAQTLEF